MLNSSRQHVVDLCDRGDLSFTTVGTHRRVRKADIEMLRERTQRLTRDQRRSLWLAYAVAGRIVADPNEASRLAFENLERMRTTSRGRRGGGSTNGNGYFMARSTSSSQPSSHPRRRIASYDRTRRLPGCSVKPNAPRCSQLGKPMTQRIGPEPRAARGRAASRFPIVDDPEIVVLGARRFSAVSEKTSSQTKLSSRWRRILLFVDDMDGSKSDSVDGAIGEGSPFHEMYSYYAQGVTIGTAVLAAGWEQRAVNAVRMRYRVTRSALSLMIS